MASREIYRWCSVFQAFFYLKWTLDTFKIGTWDWNVVAILPLQKYKCVDGVLLHIIFWLSGLFRSISASGTRKTKSASPYMLWLLYLEMTRMNMRCSSLFCPYSASSTWQDLPSENMCCGSSASKVHIKGFGQTQPSALQKPDVVRHVLQLLYLKILQSKRTMFRFSGHCIHQL